LKRLLILAFGLAGLNVASASPCAIGTLASYISLGTTGCSIGSNTAASFAALGGSFGGTPISAGSVMVTPSGGSFNPEFIFTLSQTAMTNQTFESMFTYIISGPAYLAEVISISGSSEGGNGDVTDLQNYCVGGHFGPDGINGCTGSTTGSLNAVDGFQPSDTATFPGPHLLAVTDDFVIDSGGAGSAHGGVFTDQFTAAPEPGVVLLTGTGLVFALLRKRKSHQLNPKL
jgi:hypothetical protein